MWETGSLIHDQNGDGVPDGINVNIELTEGCLPAGLIDFCARLGFETSSLSFDFFDSGKHDWTIKIKPSEQGTYCEWRPDLTIQFYYRSEDELSELFRLLARWNPDFQVLTEPVFKIALVDQQLIFYGDENTVYEKVSLPVSSETKMPEVKSLSDFWDGTSFYHMKEPSPVHETHIQFEINREFSRDLLKELCYLAARIGMSSTRLHFPFTGSGSTGLPIRIEQANTHDEIYFHKREQKLYLRGVRAVHYFARAKHWSENGDYGLWELSEHHADKNEEKLFEITWEDPGERKRLLDRCQDLASASGNMDGIKIEVFVSEPKSIRDSIKENIETLFPAATSVKVRSAFKPAFLWIEEEVLPELIPLKEKIDHINIVCLEEQRADGLELPIRWIQELYPADRFLEENLGIAADRINFALTKDSRHTFSLIARDQQGNMLYENVLDVPVSEMDYVERGKKVYPTTGAIKLFHHHSVVYEELLPTDRERFYEFYRREVLPELWAKVRKHTDDPERGFTRPLFDRIEIKASMSEEERKLGIDEERISSMEALHEDLYFNTLDYFMIKGEQHVERGFTAPGGVYPFLQAVEGPPHAVISSYSWEGNGKTEWEAHRIQLREDAKPALIELYNKHTHEKKEVSIESVELPSMTPIWEDKWHVPEEFDQRWVPAFSYRGHPIPVLEMYTPVQEDYVSPIKLSLYKPTILIESGHHANEVSSTPAVLELIQELVKEKPDLLKNINVTVIPLANPDGSLLHQRMIRDNPEWKHHAARYNAVGLEYADVRYQKSVFGEGEVVPAIMKRWAPDVVIDNHGIPSHEWIQPFAGYNSPPRFPMSYWIPNSLLYGIGRELNREKYPDHVQNLEIIIQRIGEKLRGTEIEEGNRYWMGRYYKYGTRWLPDTFPVEEIDGLNFYKWASNVSSSSIAAIERFPDWVSLDLISEAADETVYGKSLEICKLGQKLFNLAVIEEVARSQKRVERSHINEGVEMKRQRPLLFRGDGS